MSLSRIGYWLDKHMNFKMGIIAGVVTGSIVYYINYKHGYMVALGAFTKQFLWNFFMSGFNTSMCERFSKSIKRIWLSLTLATLIPTTIAFIGVYSVHYFLNTPNPLANTLWQAVANLFIFFFTGLAYHKELERKNRWIRLIISSKRRVEMSFFNPEKENRN